MAQHHITNNSHQPRTDLDLKQIYELNSGSSHIFLFPPERHLLSALSCLPGLPTSQPLSKLKQHIYPGSQTFSSQSSNSPSICISDCYLQSLNGRFVSHLRNVWLEARIWDKSSLHLKSHQESLEPGSERGVGTGAMLLCLPALSLTLACNLPPILACWVLQGV